MSGGMIGIRAAALCLGVHENTVRNWIDAGLLPAESMPGQSGFRRLDRTIVERLAHHRTAGILECADCHRLTTKPEVARRRRPLSHGCVHCGGELLEPLDALKASLQLPRRPRVVYLPVLVGGRADGERHVFPRDKAVVAVTVFEPLEREGVHAEGEAPYAEELYRRETLTGPPGTSTMVDVYVLDGLSELQAHRRVWEILTGELGEQPR